MSERTNNTACTEYGEDLVAAVWDKLEASRRVEVLKHAELCAGCGAELAEARSVKSDTDAIPQIPTTVDFRKRLIARIRRGTPARSMTPVELASIGPASRRLAGMVQRDRPVVSWLRPRLKIISLAVSAAAAAVFLLVSQLVEIETVPPRTQAVVELPQPRNEGRASVARWRERRECPDIFPVDSQGSSLDVSGILDDGTLMMTASYDVTQHEKCVLLFSSTQWDSFRAGFAAARGAEKERFERLANGTRSIQVAGGRLDVPEEIVAEFLDGGSNLVIVKLEGRTEIWARDSFGEHTRTLPPITVDMNDITLAPVTPVTRRG